jgi:hypothetical protein
MPLNTLHELKEVILDAFSIITLLTACLAVLLIELWGLKKIWKLLTR